MWCNFFYESISLLQNEWKLFSKDKNNFTNFNHDLPFLDCFNHLYFLPWLKWDCLCISRIATFYLELCCLKYQLGKSLCSCLSLLTSCSVLAYLSFCSIRNSHILSLNLIRFSDAVYSNFHYYKILKFVRSTNRIINKLFSTSSLQQLKMPPFSFEHVSIYPQKNL